MGGVITTSEPGWIGLFTGLSERQFRKLVGIVRLRGGGVPSGGRPWAGEQGGGGPKSLSHAQGEAADPVVGDIGEPDLVGMSSIAAVRASRPRRAANAARFFLAVSEG